MPKFLKKLDNHADYESYMENEASFPFVAHCLDYNDVHYVSEEEGGRLPKFSYLTFEALESGTISFNIWRSMGTDMITSISYSTDNGETWTTTNNTDNKTDNLQITVNVNSGDTVLWKGTATQTGQYDENEGLNVGSFFSSTCRFNAKGNVMSILYGDNFMGQTTLTEAGSMADLFSDCDEVLSCSVVDAADLVLPATTLVNGCYFDMFRNCESLTTTPVLPATSLANYCYCGMFYGCSGLTTAPELPATALTSNCYANMFNGCTSLTTAPELPATTLAEDCYWYMFYGCSGLATAPELPARTLANGCYGAMFRRCASLTTAPELPATTLVNGCYNEMFGGCANLTYIKTMFTTTPSTSYTYRWVSGVKSTGTFVKNSAAQWNVTGVNGIPTNWTVQTASS